MNFYLIKHLNQNKMKQTAVEWLNKELYQLDTKVRSYKTIDYIKKRQSIIQQAIEMEKQQIMQAFDKGKWDSMAFNGTPNEKYYNETFKK